MDEKLNELRKKLDSVDAEIFRLFRERMETAEEIGEAKRLAGLPTEDRERENAVIATRTTLLPERFRVGGVALARLLIEESKRAQRSARNLYLIGMPDCGKTRMGKKLQAVTGLTLSDTDRLIMVRKGSTIDAIFAAEGEEAFRDAETTVLRGLAKRGGLIVATGGGAPMREENVLVMKGSGVIAFLDRKLPALLGQNTENRPLIRAATPEETDAKIAALYAERHDKYAACADVTVDPDEPGAAEMVLKYYLENR